MDRVLVSLLSAHARMEALPLRRRLRGPAALRL